MSNGFLATTDIDIAYTSVVKMPIIIKDVSWSQTPQEVKISLKFKTPKCKSGIDIFTSRKYLKVSSSPYFWEAFLWNEIVEEESKCQLSDGLVQFQLRKRENGVDWPLLEKVKNIEEKTITIEEAQKEAHNHTISKRKAVASYREEKKREEIMNATARDAKMRVEYSNVLKAAAQEVSKHQPAKSCKVLEFPSKPPAVTKYQCEKVFPPTLEKKLPEIRKPGKISISFSDRNFVTPKRESQELQEKEWLMKQKDARKAVGFVEEDLTPAERNPQWLKTKADQFFEQKNFLGAISAYSTAIRLTDSRCFELFLNRSAAHFQVENYLKCVEDCSQAYELLVPHCSSNLQDRKNCLTRRGAALARLGLIKQGFDEIVAALKLDPSDKVLEHDAEMLRCKLERTD